MIRAFAGVRFFGSVAVEPASPQPKPKARRALATISRCLQNERGRQRRRPFALNLGVGDVVRPALFTMQQQVINLVFLGVQQGRAAFTAGEIDGMVACRDNRWGVQDMPYGWRADDSQADLAIWHATPRNYRRERTSRLSVTDAWPQCSCR